MRQNALQRNGGYTSFGYRSAAAARSMGLSYSGGTEDYHQRWDRDAIVNQSRAFYRDNFLYESLINRFVDMVIGPAGFHLQARTSNPRVNDLIEKTLWPEWAEAPEVRRMYVWQELERLVLSDCVIAGDMGAVKVRPLGQLQLVESERIGGGSAGVGQNIEQGVELDPYGRPLAYHVASYDSSGQPVGKATRFDFRDFLYLHGPFKRVSQTRAMPALQSSFSQLHRINDILDAEAIAWQVLSRFSVAITKRDADALAQANSEEDTDATARDVTTIPNRIHELQGGTVFWGEEGEEVKGIEQNRPPEAFEQNILAFLRLMSMPLGIPLEIWLIRWGDMNLSSARASLLQFYASVANAWQQLMIRIFHRRVYRWKVGSWVAAGILPNSPDILAHEWITPAYPWIDPKDEATAWALKLDRGLSTFSEALASQNKDRQEVLDVREKEIREAIGRSKKIEAETGEPVPYQIFAGMQYGKTQAAEREATGTSTPREPKASEEVVEENEKPITGSKNADYVLLHSRPENKGPVFFGYQSGKLPLRLPPGDSAKVKAASRGVWIRGTPGDVIDVLSE